MPILQIRGVAAALLAATTLLSQEPRPVELHHLYTFGSKQGIHPPGLLNRRPAKAALGNPENPYGLIYPVAVTTDPGGRIWISDSGTGSVHVFDRASGGYREIRRMEETKLQRPAGLTSDAHGRVYLTDSETGGVFVFDEHGEYDHRLIKRNERLLEGPTTIALSEDNRTIYVADPPRNVIVELNREGEVTGTIALPPEVSGPSSISVIHNQIYVLGRQQHKTGIFSPGGNQRGTIQWEGITFPTAFGFDARRQLFMVANPRWMVVQSFDEKGRNLGVFGQLGSQVDQMEGVDFIHVDRNGLVYIVDSRHGKVLVFGEDRQK